MKYTPDMLWVITAPHFIRDEVSIITDLIHAGANRVIIRKPDWKPEEYELLLNQLPSSIYSKILIRNHYQLAEQYCLAGIHWNQTPTFTTGKEHCTGIHNINELTEKDRRFNTLLLSPVFDSISKPGYKGLHACKIETQNRTVLALGGVNHTNIASLKNWNFNGAALLGAIWKHPETAIQSFLKIQKAWKQSDQRQ
ncbi:thiamine phosphate synthase [Chitinophaga silvatica]|uniref:thiamine phosphate synthase n=1 Tax=Chitinophaga silvatica TaxID=2282649 RepID=UPI001314BB24|nr:thiamine phosphate synthase [Chitinophaga silvatica]